MVFSSIPLYPDPPNFHQQVHQNENRQHPPPPPPPPPRPPSTGGGGSGLIRPGPISKPGSGADRARLPKILQPDAAALKCPRCESTNTKFCYFNNYSLTQPRHFCKSCRRYWTRGGALRNVPVGGGCRRNNKRSKASSRRSKSPSAAASNSTTNILGHLQPPSQIHLPFLPHLHNSLADYGLNFGSIHPPSAAVTGGGGGGGCRDVEFQIGEQWRVQQFPFLCNLEPSTELYTIEGDGVAPPGYGGASELQLKPAFEVRSDQVGGGVKMEENHLAGLNLLSRNFLGLQGNDQYWSGSNAWSSTDYLSGFSSSTSHFL